MATTIKLKRSGTPGSVPTTSDLVLGELSLNTNDGKIYLKKSVSGTESIVGFSPYSLSNGNSNVFVAANGNITISSAGNANVLTVTGLGANLVGNLTADGIKTDNYYYANGNPVSFGGGSGLTYTASSTPPTSPALGDQWYNTSTDVLYLRVSDGTNDFWLDAISSGAASTPVKTFNILNEFTAPLQGSAIYVPHSPVTIKSIILTNGQVTTGDLTVGLYRNGDFLAFYTIPGGSVSNSYAGLNHYLTPSDYITVSVVSGSGLNFSMQLFNTDLN
jgi:hypothetical protein